LLASLTGGTTGVLALPGTGLLVKRPGGVAVLLLPGLPLLLATAAAVVKPRAAAADAATFAAVAASAAVRDAVRSMVVGMRGEGGRGGEERREGECRGKRGANIVKVK